jgi:hypothetical protein
LNASLPLNLTPSYTVNNNTVRNINLPAIQTSIILRGIFVSNSAEPTISGNTISNLTSNTANLTTVGTGVAISGICIGVGTGSVAQVTDNTISGLRALNTSSSVTPHVSGIVLSSGKNTNNNGHFYS